MGKWIGIGFLLQLGGVGIISLLFIVVALARKKKVQAVRKKLGPGGKWTLGYQEFMVDALLEELIFRGLLLIILLIWKLPLWVWVLIIIVDGTVFGFRHFQGTLFLFEFLNLSWVGVVLSVLVIKTASLIPSFLCHFLWLAVWKTLFHLTHGVFEMRIKPSFAPEE